MPGFILHQGAVVILRTRRAGSADCDEPIRCLVSGMPTTTLCAIRGRGMRLSASARRERAMRDSAIHDGLGPRHLNGLPFLLFDSQAICVPTGTPTITSSTQTRVIAT